MLPDVQMIEVLSVNHWKSTGEADSAATYIGEIQNPIYNVFLILGKWHLLFAFLVAFLHVALFLFYFSSSLTV